MHYHRVNAKLQIHCAEVNLQNLDSKPCMLRNLNYFNKEKMIDPYRFTF